MKLVMRTRSFLATNTITSNLVVIIHLSFLLRLSVVVCWYPRGVLNIVIKLVDKQADPSCSNASGTQPIHKAAIYGNSAVVKKLIE